MLEQIFEFLDKKKIDNELIRNVLKYCIIEHTNIFKEVIPFEEVMKRLDTNLENIWFKNDSNQSFNYIKENMVAQYVGFDENSINLYFEKDDLKNDKLKQDFIDILVHEIIHAIYNKKNNDLYETETQVFCTMEKTGNRVSIVKGDDVFLEPIINFIACLIIKKVNSLYVASTNAMFKLANTIDYEKMIKAVFYLDEELFLSCFPSLEAYKYFKEGISYLNYSSSYDRGMKIIDNYLNGNIEIRKNEFQEIKPIRR